MRRVRCEPRPNWQAKVEQWGLVFHTEEDGAYWFESAFYEFTPSEIEALEVATNELHRMCLEAVDYVILNRRYADFSIPKIAIPAIEAAWELDPPMLYGRFDFSFSGTGSPKMLEYNADTPTSLLEAAVIQWKWLEDLYPGHDQFNSIWDALVDEWKWLVAQEKLKGSTLHFAHCALMEDELTVAVLRDTAREAGLGSKALLMDEIGYDRWMQQFVDCENLPIETIFKLYPWEWIVKEEFGEPCLKSFGKTQWIEPIWKMIVSNKAILAILWEMFPSSPYLLPAYLDGPREIEAWVKKPLLGREGANVEIFGLEASGGEYGVEGFVFQKYAPLPKFDEAHPVIGSWVVGMGACGIGIRETDHLITDNLARFVPHRIESI